MFEILVHLQTSLYSRSSWVMEMCRKFSRREVFSNRQRDVAFCRSSAWRQLAMLTFSGLVWSHSSSTYCRFLTCLGPDLLIRLCTGPTVAGFYFEILVPFGAWHFITALGVHRTCLLMYWAFSQARPITRLFVWNGWRILPTIAILGNSHLIWRRRLDVWSTNDASNWQFMLRCQ